jgi:hypothetical protein
MVGDTFEVYTTKEVEEYKKAAGDLRLKLSGGLQECISPE